MMSLQLPCKGKYMTMSRLNPQKRKKEKRKELHGEWYLKEVNKNIQRFYEE